LAATSAMVVLVNMRAFLISSSWVIPKLYHSWMGARRA
jgi:hypothetical protein